MKKLMMALVLASGSLNAADIQLDKQIEFDLLSVDGAEVNAKTTGVTLAVRGQYEFDPTFKFITTLGAVMETGSHKAINNNSFQLKRAVGIDDAYFRWTPFSFVKVEGGAINQRMYSSPLFLTEVPFLAAVEKGEWGSDAFSLYVQAQQAIPVNDDISQRVGEVEDGNPQFFAETIGLKLASDLIKSRLEYTHFQFKDLSRAVAHQSRFRGNRVDGIGSTNAFFLSRFVGSNILGQIQFSVYKDFSLGFEGEYLVNSKATTDQDTGYIGSLLLDWDKWGLVGGVYRNERDSSVAYYNDKNFGNNNRKGCFVRYHRSFDKDKSLRVSYFDFDVIQNDVYQRDGKVASLEFVLKI